MYHITHTTILLSMKCKLTPKKKGKNTCNFISSCQHNEELSVLSVHTVYCQN